MHMPKPLIAILLDENTSDGGSAYAIGKRYFEAVQRVGGRAIGLPFDPELVDWAIANCDGLLCPGGRFAFLPEHYAYGLTPRSPKSDRLQTEMMLIDAFLREDKPVLGICSGMQLLGCLHGAKMTPDLLETEKVSTPHDEAGRRHNVAVEVNSRLFEILELSEFQVNTYHSEALVSVGEGTTISARSDDDLIEAIELPDKRFAIGVQWHPERDDLPQDPSSKLFKAFVDACRGAN